MILSERLTVLIVLISVQTGVNDGAVVKRDDGGKKSGNHTSGLMFFGGNEEINLEREILQEINHLNPRKQREIFNDLEKQNEKFNVSQKSLVLSETENISPLNVEELKSIRKTIKASNSSLPAIRNKRTLNFLLQALVRALGYTLTPSNPDAEWLPRQQPPPPPAQPCTTPPPPCRPNPPSTPPPCPMPPTPPPCSGGLIQPATIPPNQINPNTISYPFRPARTIPLFNFAPLPAGLRVPYPPLLQPPAQQRAPCPPQQPSPPPCGTPAPPCGTPPPSTPAPCTPSPPPPCTTPAPSPPPCTPPPPPPPPCTTPAPSPPPCGTTPKPPPCQPAPPPPCGTTPAPKPQPCQPTPAPCPTPSPSPPPCPSPSPPPCATPAPAPPPCGNPPPAPPPPSTPPKKGSILLEYEDPVRIQIFSNDKKYLPASGNIFSGNDEEKKDWHSYFYPENEKNRKKDEDYEEKEETEEEHIEEEEDEETPGQLKHYEEEDERVLANEEEDESETNLSVVKKPAEKEVRKTKKQRMVSKGKAGKEKNEDEKQEKTQKMKKPKRKKWIRIVKKQRRKTKTDPNNANNFQIYTSDSFSEASHVAPKYYEKRDSEFAFDSYERDVSDFSDDSSSHSSEDVGKLDLKKVIVNKKQINSPEALGEARAYEFNFNPYASEPEEQRRKKLEKAVERYVEDYVEKQLGNELIKNTGIPKTTVFEFAPKNGPKIQTITTTVAKTSGNPSNFKPQTTSDSRNRYKSPTGNGHILRKSSYEENSKKRGDVSYEEFTSRT